MSPKAPPKILEKWFRGFTPRLRGDESTQSFSGIMGSAHTPKCLHTGRNPVFCGKPNNSGHLLGRQAADNFMSGADKCLEKLAKLLISLIKNV